VSHRFDTAIVRAWIVSRVRNTAYERLHFFFLHKELSWSWKLARWVLTCPQCKQEFTHSDVNEPGEGGASLLDAFSWIAGKPEFPEQGLYFACPVCKVESTYQRHELIYKTD
jgi:hypothetical protein